MDNAAADRPAPVQDGVDVLLVDPPDTFSRYPYIGLCVLASELRGRGIRVEILDAPALGYSSQDIVEYVLARRPKIVGITVLSSMLRICYLLIQEIKSKHPEATIVVGGPHINSDPDIIAPMGVRYGFRGDCHSEFADFCGQVLAGHEPQRMPGLVVNDGGRVSSEPPKVLADLDSMPMPAYDLLPLDKYYAPVTNLRTMAFISSQGCPFGCIYCYNPMRSKPRFMSNDRVLDQIGVLLKKHGVRHIEFCDELFTMDRQRVFDLCRKIRERRLEFSWAIETRVNMIDEEMLAAMKQAGCIKVAFGLETASESIRFLINKTVTDKEIADAVRLCKRHGIKILGFFILGLPTETEADVYRTIRFARGLGLDYAWFFKPVPLIKTELFERGVREGLFGRDVWTRFMLGERPFPVYLPEGMSLGTLNRAYRRAWVMMYFWPPNVWRNRRVLFHPQHFFNSLRAFVSFFSDKIYEGTSLLKSRYSR